MICSGADAGYYSYTSVPSTYRSNIISTYRSWGSGGRCPERGGYEYWLGDLYNRAQSMGGTASSYSQVWYSIIKPSLDAASYQNDERGYGGVMNANYACQSAARSTYGYYSSAYYISGTGNQCSVTL